MISIFEIFSKLNELDETYFDKSKLAAHHAKHVAPTIRDYLFDLSDESLDPMTQEEYDERGNKLSQEPVYSSDYDSDEDVIGFYGVDDLGRESVYKFRKSTSELVIYYANYKSAKTVSYYKVQTSTQKQRYNKLKAKYYIRDILPEDDYYNA